MKQKKLAEKKFLEDGGAQSQHSALATRSLLRQRFGKILYTSARPLITSRLIHSMRRPAPLTPPRRHNRPARLDSLVPPRRFQRKGHPMESYGPLKELERQCCTPMTQLILVQSCGTARTTALIKRAER